MVVGLAAICRLQIGDTAGCKPALPWRREMLRREIYTNPGAPVSVQWNCGKTQIL
jgi:hypothetical protein